MMAKDKTIILVESWELMRKFIEEVVKKIDQVIIEQEFTNIDKAHGHLINSDASILICEIPANSEEKVLETIKKLKAIRPDIKIVLSTLTSSKKLEEQAKKAGADRIWQKEISEKSFMKMFKSLVG